LDEIGSGSKHKTVRRTKTVAKKKRATVRKKKKV
jgi:hypothetical protein